MPARVQLRICNLGNCITRILQATQRRGNVSSMQALQCCDPSHLSTSVTECPKAALKRHTHQSGAITHLQPYNAETVVRKCEARGTKLTNSKILQVQAWAHRRIRQEPQWAWILQRKCYTPRKHSLISLSIRRLKIDKPLIQVAISLGLWNGRGRWPVGGDGRSRAISERYGPEDITPVQEIGISIHSSGVKTSNHDRQNDIPKGMAMH